MYGLKQSITNRPRDPKKIFFPLEALATKEKASAPSPKIIKGSFRIPEEQKSKFGRRRSNEKINQGFNKEYFLSARKSKYVPISEMKQKIIM